MPLTAHTAQSRGLKAPRGGSLYKYSTVSVPLYSADGQYHFQSWNAFHYYWRYHCCGLIFFAINKTAQGILTFARVFFGASHPSVLPCSILHLLRNQRTPNEPGRACPKGNSQHPARSDHQPDSSRRAVTIHPGGQQRFWKRDGRPASNMCGRAHLLFFIWGEHMSGRKRETRPYFFKGYKIA